MSVDIVARVIRPPIIKVGVTKVVGPPGPPGGGEGAEGDENANPGSLAQRTATGALRGQTPLLDSEEAHADDLINRGYATPYLQQVTENTEHLGQVADDLTDTNEVLADTQEAVVVLAGNLDNLGGRMTTAEEDIDGIETTIDGFVVIPPVTGKVTPYPTLRGTINVGAFNSLNAIPDTTGIVVWIAWLGEGFAPVFTTNLGPGSIATVASAGSGSTQINVGVILYDDPENMPSGMATLANDDANFIVGFQWQFQTSGALTPLIYGTTDDESVMGQPVGTYPLPRKVVSVAVGVDTSVQVGADMDAYLVNVGGGRMGRGGIQKDGFETTTFTQATAAAFAQLAVVVDGGDLDNNNKWLTVLANEATWAPLPSSLPSTVNIEDGWVLTVIGGEPTWVPPDA